MHDFAPGTRRSSSATAFCLSPPLLWAETFIFRAVLPEGRSGAPGARKAPLNPPVLRRALPRAMPSAQIHIHDLRSKESQRGPGRALRAGDKRLSRRIFVLLSGLVLAFWHFTAPALACDARPRGNLCAIIPASALVRDAPGGRVAYGASGIVIAGRHSRDGLWARIQLPCAGFKGWIARRDLLCQGNGLNARAAANPSQ